MKYLFIVTYGRSGSTLLQGVLSSTPGFLIRGENGDALYRLYKFHTDLEKQRNRRTGPEELPVTHAWYGIDKYPSGIAIQYIRDLAIATLLRPAPDTRVAGFKEIRWRHDDWRAYMKFIRKVFPGARFIINTRNHSDVINSNWWGKLPPEKALYQIEKHEEIILAMAEELGPERAYRIHYDDYVGDPSVLEGLFGWLGEPFNLDRVTDVMSRKHSS